MPHKKVTFGFVTTFYILECLEVREYRKRYWENYAVDRIRFLERIQHAEKLLQNDLLIQQTVNTIHFSGNKLSHIP